MGKCGNKSCKSVMNGVADDNSTEAFSVAASARPRPLARLLPIQEKSPTRQLSNRARSIAEAMLRSCPCSCFCGEAVVAFSSANSKAASTTTAATREPREKLKRMNECGPYYYKVPYYYIDLVSQQILAYISECPRSEDRMERFACPSPDFRGRYRCIDDRSLCDGFFDCPAREDENPDMCLFYKTVSISLAFTSYLVSNSLETR